MSEFHPYNDYSSIQKGTLLLVIGTAPPERFSKPRHESWKPQSEKDIDFYYGSEENLLWSKIVPKLCPEFVPVSENDSADRRRSFLRSRKIWMHDICERYTRAKTNSALDKHLKVFEYTDLSRILKEHETIHTLVFTGTTAEKCSGKQMETQKLLSPYQFNAGGLLKSKLPRQRLLSISVDGIERKLQTFTVPSPSRRTLPVYPLDKMIELYRVAICEQLS